MGYKCTQMTTVTLTLLQLFQLLYSRVFKGVYFHGPSVTQITAPVDHAEGPTWDSRKNILYFVNIHQGEVYAYHYGTGKLDKIMFDGDVSPVVPSKRNADLMFIGLNRSLVAVEWDGESLTGRYRILATVSPQFPLSRFNDGKADSEGRLWFGTMGFENGTTVRRYEGILYRITRKTVTKPDPIIYPVSISNGMAWNKDNDKFYYIDTPTRQVREYKFDAHRGLVYAYPRIAFDLAHHPTITGFPDGMTIDEEDNLWIALFNGGAVIKVNPTNGELLQIVAIPAQLVTSVAWGGPNNEVLFVTTSRFQLNKQQSKLQPAAGSVFAVTKLGTKGLPASGGDILDSIDEIISEYHYGSVSVDSISSYVGNGRKNYR